MFCDLKRKFYPFFVAIPLVLSLYSCITISSLIKKGDNLMTIGEYAKANEVFRRSYNKVSIKDRFLKGELSYKQAIACQKYGNIARAISLYKNAIRYGYNDSTIYVNLGNLQRMVGDYKSAQQNYLKIMSNIDHTSLLYKQANFGLLACNEQYNKKQKKIYTIGLVKEFNSNRSDYSPMYLPPDYKQVYFTSTRSQSKGDELSGITLMKSGDLYVAKKDEKGKWKKNEAIDELNTEYDEGVCSFTSDGKIIFFTRCRKDNKYPKYAEIWVSERSNAKWSQPFLLKITADTLSSYAHPAITPDGKYLYFTSDMPGGYGGFDLWRVPMNGTKINGAIENLGEEINTIGNEVFPYVRNNGDLFFSSDFHTPNYGGLDIYFIPNYINKENVKNDLLENFHFFSKMQILDTIKSYKIKHLPYPINSTYDDFGITFEGQHSRGYFTSSRLSKGRGWDKIYSFSYPERILSVKGWIYEQDGYELPKAQVYVVGSNGYYNKLSVMPNGSFEENIEAGVNYLFLATCNGFLNIERHLNLDTIKKIDNMIPHQYILQFPLPNIKIPVLIKGIYYKYNQAEIEDSSKVALNQLVELLKENPNIRIELSSHCDYRGSDTYNNKLSFQRAQNIVNYLIKEGINPHRLIAQGYGKKKPLIITRKINEKYPFLTIGDSLTQKYIAHLSLQEQEIANALNRRTEFKVISSTFGLFDNNGNLKINIIHKEISDKKKQEDSDFLYEE